LEGIEDGYSKGKKIEEIGKSRSGFCRMERQEVRCGEAVWYTFQAPLCVEHYVHKYFIIKVNKLIEY